MKDSLLKAFMVYAYSFVLLFMFNSLVIVLMMKIGLSPTAGTIFSYVFTPIVLYLAYGFSVRRFLGKPFDERMVPKAWLYQFIPFFVISVVAFRIIATLVRQPAVAVFVFLNVEIIIIYFTFRYSVEKVLLKEGKNG